VKKILAAALTVSAAPAFAASAFAAPAFAATAPFQGVGVQLTDTSLVNFPTNLRSPWQTEPAESFVSFHMMYLRQIAEAEQHELEQVEQVARKLQRGQA